MKLMSIGLAGAIACAIPVGLAAQDVHAPMPLDIAWFGHLGHPALDPFLDSLAAISTVADLGTIEQRWNPRVHRVEGPLGRLRLGFHRLRRGQLAGGREAFDQALATFREATREAPDDPKTWYAQGLANLELRRRDYPNLAIAERHMSSYMKYYLGARESFRRSLLADPLFDPTIGAVTTLAAMEGERTQPVWLVEALRRKEAVASDPRRLLVLGRQARIADDYETARAEFARYLARGGDSAVAALELARTVADLEEPDSAVDWYWTGAGKGGAVGRRLYRADLSWIATNEELAEFDALASDSMVPWLHEFWSVRELQNVRPPNTRLRQHLQRWNLTHQRYRVVRSEARAVHNPILSKIQGACTVRAFLVDDLDFPRPSRPKDLRTWEPTFDDRAILVMRHGMPFARAWFSYARRYAIVSDSDFGGSGVLVPDLAGTVEDPGDENDDAGSVEAWSYIIDGHQRFYFLGGSLALGTGPTTILGHPSPGLFFAAFERGVIPQGGLASDVRRDLARMRHDLLVRQAGFERAVPSSRCTRAYQDWRQWSEEGIETAVHTDGDVLFFPKDLYPSVQAMGMPGQAGTQAGTILIAFGIPADRLPRSDSTASVALRIRVAGIETGTRDGFWVDTTRTLALGESLADKSYLTGLLEIPARPAEYDVRVAVQLADSSAGNAVDLPGTTVAWVPDDSLRLSDAVVGGAGDNLLWNSLGEPVSINALAAFLPRDTVELYYVQAGLRPGESYRTELRLSEVGDDDAVLSFTFEEVAARPLETKRRGLALRGVDPGEYELTMTLRAAAGNERVTRIRRITVVD